jgi:hypothetical protein
LNKTVCKDATLTKLTGGLLLMLLLVCASGCRFPFNKRGPQQPVVFSGPATQQQIIAAVNANSSKVQQLESRLKLAVPGLPAITGDLAVEQPRRLRMQAGFMGTSAGGIDVGSNDEVFWLWVKSALGGQQPAIYYGRHDEYANSQARQAIPIDPSFLMDSLGLYQFDPGDRHEGPYQRQDGNLEIRSFHATPAGETVQIVVIDSKLGNVVEQHLYEGQSLVASSYASDFQYYADQQVSLPRVVNINALPNSPEEMRLTLTADSYTINQLYSGPSLWQMPQPDGVSVIDVARAAPQQLSLQRPVSTADYSPNRPRLSDNFQRFRGGNLLRRQ